MGLRGRYSDLSEIAQLMSSSFKKLASFVKSKGIKSPSYASVYIMDPKLSTSSQVDFITGIFEEQISLQKGF